MERPRKDVSRPAPLGRFACGRVTLTRPNPTWDVFFGGPENRQDGRCRLGEADASGHPEGPRLVTRTCARHWRCGTEPGPAAQSVEDQQEKAFILARLPERAKREEAITILEALVRPAAHGAAPGPPCPGPSSCLWPNSTWPKGTGDGAREHMLALMSNQGKDSRYVAASSSPCWLPSPGRRKRPIPSRLEQLEQLRPSEFPTIQLKAAAMIRRGQVDEPFQSAAGMSGQAAEPGLMRACGWPSQPPSASGNRGLSASPRTSQPRRNLAAEAEPLQRAVKEYPERELLLAGSWPARAGTDQALGCGRTGVAAGPIRSPRPGPA